MSTLTISGTGEMYDYSDGTIGPAAPWNESKDIITKVVIKEGVTSLGLMSMNGLNMASIYIPSSVTSVPAGAFWFCRKLIKFSVSTSNANYKAVDGVLFSKNGEILICFPDARSGEYAVPEGVLEIADNAFYGSYNLTALIFPSSILSIGSRAVESCEELRSVGVIPAGVTKIGSRAFCCCTSLLAINVNAENTNYLSKDGVLYTKSMDILLQVPGGLTGEYTIPEAVKTVEPFALAGCTALTEVRIPNGITEIKQGTFAYCTALMALYIPESLFYIREYAFQNCNALMEVYYAGEEEQWDAITVASKRQQESLLCCQVL